MEEQVLLHDDELDEKKRHELRDGPSRFNNLDPDPIPAQCHPLRGA
jgi:hypothetical protein